MARPLLHPNLSAALLLAVAIIAPPLTLAASLQAPSLQAPSHTTPGPALLDDQTHPPDAHGWVETRLYFGLGPARAPHRGVSASTWQEFLDREVTPRFPSGLSVEDLYGQWQAKPTPGHPASSPSRIRSKALLIVYPATPENIAAIDAIRSAWKQRTGDQSVLKVTTPVDVSF